MTTDLSELKRVIDVGYSAYKADQSGALFSDFAKVFYDTFKVVCDPCIGCNNGFDAGWKKANDYYNHKLNNPTMEDPTPCQFTIKGGGTINSKHGDFAQITLKDEHVFHMLKAEPALINSFEKFPPDWQKQMEDFHADPANAPKAEAKDETDPSDPNGLLTKSKSELQKFASEKGFETEEWQELNKMKLIEYLDKKLSA